MTLVIGVNPAILLAQDTTEPVPAEASPNSAGTADEETSPSDPSLPLQPRVIVIETSPDIERTEVIRKVVEALERSGNATTVSQPLVGKPVERMAQIAARYDTPAEQIIKLIETLKDVGILKLKFAASSGVDNEVVVTAPDDVTWREVKQMEEALAKHPLFVGNVRVAASNDPISPTGPNESGATLSPIAAAPEPPAVSAIDAGGGGQAYADGGRLVGPLGIPESAIPGKTWVEGGSVIIAISDDGKRVFGYSERHPRWAVQELESLAGVKAIPVVSQDLAAVQHGNSCYAFNSTLGSWHLLRLPVGEIAVPAIGDDSVSVHSASQGDYAFKNSWGKWFSAEEIKTGKVAEFLASQSKENPASQEPEAAAMIKIFALKYVNAVDAARILQQLLGDAPSIAVEERTNELIVRGDAKMLSEIEALLMRLDDAKPANLKIAAQSAASQGGLGRAVDSKASGPTPQDVYAALQKEQRDEQGFNLHVANVDESVGDLRQEFSEYEKSAQQLAKNVRARALPDGSTPEIHRQNLRSVVQQAFETRQKLQRAELAEFARRLQGIQQSIELRDRIGKQIVDRRVEELLDPNLKWEEADSTPKKAPRASSTQRDLDLKSATSPPRFAGTVQVTFEQKQFGKVQWLAGPGGMMVNGFGKGQINTPYGSTTNLRLTGIPGKEDAAVLLRLDIPERSAVEKSRHGLTKQIELLAHNAIPLQVSDDDLEQVLSGNVVTKAIYIPYDLSSVTSPSLFSDVASTRLNPGVDPIKKASESGTVVAVVRLSVRAESLSSDKTED